MKYPFLVSQSRHFETLWDSLGQTLPLRTFSIDCCWGHFAGWNCYDLAGGPAWPKQSLPPPPVGWAGRLEQLSSFFPFVVAKGLQPLNDCQMIADFELKTLLFMQQSGQNLSHKCFLCVLLLWQPILSRLGAVHKWHQFVPNFKKHTAFYSPTDSSAPRYLPFPRPKTNLFLDGP